MPFLAAIPLAAQLLVLVADRPPVLNVEPTCRSVAARSASGAPVETCVRSENDARDRMIKDWAEFAAADRNQCRQLSSLGGSPSYVELLTCLEMARTARALKDKTPPSTTGQAVPDAIPDAQH